MCWPEGCKYFLTTRPRWLPGTRWREMIAAQSDHAKAQAEFQDVLKEKIRSLGPDHQSTALTARLIETLQFDLVDPSRRRF